MTIDWWTLGLQTVNVLVLLWILRRFLFRPVAAIVAARQAEAARILDDAAAARTAAEAERTAARKEAEATAAGRAAAFSAAKAEADRMRDGLLADARAEADRMIAEARAAAAREGRLAEAAAADNARRLAARLADRLLDRLPPEGRLAGFAAGLADAVADLSADARTRLAAAAPLAVTAARLPDETEAAALKARLAAAFGHPVDVVLAEDPALLAGYELTGGGVVVANSLSADLSRIVKDLARDDGAP